MPAPGAGPDARGTTATASGTEALAVLGDRTRSVDLLLTDIRMPGLQGTDLAAMACQVRPGIAVLVMSGYPGGAVAERGAHYLQKPFDSPALARSVRAALLAARQEPPPIGV